MMPGMNPRKMNQMMKRMGIAQKNIEAEQVIIRTSENEIIINNPSVQKVNMMGKTTYQISGQEEIREYQDEEVEISEEDIKTVVEQTGKDPEIVREKLKENEGDLAASIMELKEE